MNSSHTRQYHTNEPHRYLNTGTHQGIARLPVTITRLDKETKYANNTVKIVLNKQL